MGLIDAEYIKAVMLNDRLMQGNAEFTLYAQQVETQVNALPSIEIIRCRECRWGKPYSDKQLKCNALGLGGLKFPDDFCSYGCRDSEKPNNSERSSE